MESPSDTFNIATQLLMELALAPSVEDLLKMLVARSAESPELISLQIWLVQKMDGSLQIAAASGKVPPACSAARIPARTGILGKIVATLRQVALRDSDSEWKQLDHPDWLQQEGVRGFICTLFLGLNKLDVADDAADRVDDVRRIKVSSGYFMQHRRE